MTMTEMNESAAARQIADVIKTGNAQETGRRLADEFLQLSQPGNKNFNGFLNMVEADNALDRKANPDLPGLKHETGWFGDLKVDMTKPGAKLGNLWRSNEEVFADLVSGNILDTMVSDKATAFAENGSSAAANDNSHIIARRGSDVFATDSSSTTAQSGSSVEALRDANVTAEAGSKVKAEGWANVEADAGSHVTAIGTAKITAENGSNVDASDHSTVFAKPGSHVSGQDWATVFASPGAFVSITKRPAFTVEPEDEHIDSFDSQ
jgi:hypothetical protein